MVLSIYRYQNDPKLLLLSDLMESEEADVSGGEFQNTKNGFTHLILQDLFASDFQMAEIDRDENGLDFTQTFGRNPKYCQQYKVQKDAFSSETNRFKLVCLAGDLLLHS